jgi:hypothetical protein
MTEGKSTSDDTPRQSQRDVASRALTHMRVYQSVYHLSQKKKNELLAKSIVYLEDDASHFTLLRVNIPH